VTRTKSPFEWRGQSSIFANDSNFKKAGELRASDAPIVEHGQVNPSPFTPKRKMKDMKFTKDGRGNSVKRNS
jgi:hypothetical protein